MEDPFADKARGRPLSRRTLRLREQYVLSAVTALVRSGTAPADIRCLGDVTSPAAFKAIMRERLPKGDARASAYDEGLAKALVAIAKEWVRPPMEVLEELKRLKSKLRPPPPGLTEKNKAILREFADPLLIKRLLTLPEELWAKAERRQFSFRALAEYEAALAINILTFAPLRIANLASLEFGRTLRLPSRDGLCAHIDIPGEETKGGQPYMIELPPALTRKLRVFADRLREEYQDTPRFLFENGSGGMKPASTLSWLIKRTIRKHLGISMTAHQFRHVMGDLVISDEPSASSFETARQLLGHRNLSTTIKHYTGQNTLRAGRRHHELLEAKLAQVTAAARASNKRARQDQPRAGGSNARR
jgi:integrase